MTPPPGPVSRLVCAGCGEAAAPPDVEPFPFRCARARPGDDIDHIVRPVRARPLRDRSQDASPNPFIRYRALLHSHHLAASRGLTDAEFTSLVSRLDAAVADVDGRGFHETPFGRQDALSAALGFTPGRGVWVKDETGNVSGSHKARHLMGVAVYLEVVERLGLLPAPPPVLAIASCGNAALAAAVVARATGRPLRVFVPPHASADVMSRLRALGAEIVVCPRAAGVGGDPCYLRFREALGPGVIPFSCQGPETGLAIEGGQTLAWEMIDALPGQGPDRLFLQVGGGMLASACIQAYANAATPLPRIHAVQTTGASPLKRGYDRLAKRLLERIRRVAGAPPSPGAAATADFISRHAPPDVVDDEMRWARHHRSQVMWAWESEPRSVASGILDDETYDWAVVVDGMLRSGGYPVVVTEGDLIEANRLARATTGVPVDHTGSAGLAGVLALTAQDPAIRREAVAVIFTGISRRST